MTFFRKDPLLVAIFVLFTPFAIVRGVDPEPENILICNQTKWDPTTLYNFSYPAIKTGELIPFSKYKGKVVLIVNLATFYNRKYSRHYNKLRKLQNTLGDDLAILGFPCHQFDHGAPGGDGDIMNSIKYVRPGKKFVPNFQMFTKIQVNGNNEHPLFTHLKKYCPPTTFVFKQKRLFYTPIRSNDVSWSFETFVVDKHGMVRYRGRPKLKPDAWSVYIIHLINE